LKGKRGNVRTNFGTGPRTFIRGGKRREILTGGAENGKKLSVGRVPLRCHGPVSLRCKSEKVRRKGFSGEGKQGPRRGLLTKAKEAGGRISVTERGGGLHKRGEQFDRRL